MSVPDQHESRVALIGTSNHKAMPPLPAVANNISALREALCNPAIWGVSSNNCISVLDPMTPPEMLDPVRAAAESATDTLVVYFAGHGLLNDNGQLHLSLVDSSNDRMYSAVPYDYLRNLIFRSRARRRIVILDCCYSGRALGVMGDDGVTGILNRADIDGTYLIAATAENVPALAPDGDRYTAFTAELLKIIVDGVPDQPEKAFLSLNTIFDYVSAAMEGVGRPRPQKRERNVVGRCTLVRNRAYGARPLPFGYGEVEGVVPRTTFCDRRALHDAQIHRPLRAGICGTPGRGGAESIVVSGGYKDDIDYGHVIIYTGHGGRDPNTGKQIKDQEPDDPGNAALLKSIMTRMPVRVIRGSGGNPDYSPAAGYSYDGLYNVGDYWSSKGIDGHRIIQFLLKKTSDAIGRDEEQDQEVGRSLSLPDWRYWKFNYRDFALADKVIRAHDYECQVCGISLRMPGGQKYAVVVYIRGLDVPHQGPNISENMLCMCPNHAALFELGSITIGESLEIIDEIDGEPMGKLRVMPRRHVVGREYLRYHRRRHRFNASDNDV